MKDFFKHKGFDVEFDGGKDYKNEKEFDNAIIRKLVNDEYYKRINTVCEKSKIVIKEIQVQSEINE